METTIQNETLSTLVRDFNLGNNVSEELLQLGETDARFLKDLRININNGLNLPSLSKKEAYFIAYAVAINEKNTVLKSGFKESALANGASVQELSEVIACTSLMNTNNVYYRFKHFAKKEFYDKAQAGIRMSIMVNPVLGKEFFELLSLAISAVNGCEMCVTSHEESVLKHGGTQERILDAVRLAAIIKGFTSIL